MADSTGENGGKNLSEIRDLSKKLTDKSTFVQNLAKDDKRVYTEMLNRIKDDTRGELTATEYESLAKMSFFCDRFESLFRDTDPSAIDSDLFEIYRKMKTQIVVFLKEYRKDKRVSPPSIVKIQNYLIDMKAEFDDMGNLKLKKKEPEIIDVTDILDGDDG